MFKPASSSGAVMDAAAAAVGWGAPTSPNYNPHDDDYAPPTSPSYNPASPNPGAVGMYMLPPTTYEYIQSQKAAAAATKSAQAKKKEPQAATVAIGSIHVIWDTPPTLDDIASIDTAIQAVHPTEEYAYDTERSPVFAMEVLPTPGGGISPLARALLEQLQPREQALLREWTLSFAKRWSDIASSAYYVDEDEVADELRRHVTDSTVLSMAMVAQQTAAAASSSSSSPPPPPAALLERIKEVDTKRFTRVLFGGGRSPAKALPVGLVLLEGRGAEHEKGYGVSPYSDIRPREIGVGTVIERRRATGCSWHPASAAGFVATKNWEKDAAIQPILLAHHIASPRVLAIDVLGMTMVPPFIGRYTPAHVTIDQEREFVLQPFLKFHVVRDRFALLTIHPMAAPKVVRLLETHVYVEDACPLCAKPREREREAPAAEDESRSKKSKLLGATPYNGDAPMPEAEAEVDEDELRRALAQRIRDNDAEAMRDVEAAPPGVWQSATYPEPMPASNDWRWYYDARALTPAQIAELDALAPTPSWQVELPAGARALRDDDWRFMQPRRVVDRRIITAANVGDWIVSLNLDGTRVLWDGRTMRAYSPATGGLGEALRVPPAWLALLPRGETFDGVLVWRDRRAPPSMESPDDWRHCHLCVVDLPRWAHVNLRRRLELLGRIFATPEAERARGVIRLAKHVALTQVAQLEATYRYNTAVKCEKGILVKHARTAYDAKGGSGGGAWAKMAAWHRTLVRLLPVPAEVETPRLGACEYWDADAQAYVVMVERLDGEHQQLLLNTRHRDPQRHPGERVRFEDPRPGEVLRASYASEDSDSRELLVLEALDRQGRPSDEQWRAWQAAHALEQQRRTQLGIQ